MDDKTTRDRLLSRREGAKRSGFDVRTRSRPCKKTAFSLSLLTRLGRMLTSLAGEVENA